MTYLLNEFFFLNLKLNSNNYFYLQVSIHYYLLLDTILQINNGLYLIYIIRKLVFYLGESEGLLA